MTVLCMTRVLALIGASPVQAQDPAWSKMKNE